MYVRPCTTVSRYNDEELLFQSELDCPTGLTSFTTYVLPPQTIFAGRQQPPDVRENRTYVVSRKLSR